MILRNPAFSDFESWCLSFNYPYSMSFSGTAKICLLHPFFNIAVLSFFYAAGTLVTECVGKSDYAGNVPFVSD